MATLSVDGKQVAQGRIDRTILSRVSLRDTPDIDEVHAELRCDLRHGLRRPRQGDDGSIDLYFGAKPPPGKEKNWMALVPGRGFFAIIRLYSPTEAAFDGSWKPSDFEATP